MGNSGEPDKTTEQLEQQVRMGALDADEVTIASSAAIETAKKDSYAERGRKDSYRDLMAQLNSVNDFLKRLDMIIAEAEAQLAILLEKQAQALIEAEQSFGRMHEAEDLITDIRDGISGEEKERLVEMLGVDAETLSVEELTILLQQEMKTSHEAGLEQTERAEELEDRIQTRREAIDSLKDKREEYEHTETPEARQAIEDEFTSDASENESHFHEEVTFSTAPLPP